MSVPFSVSAGSHGLPNTNPDREPRRSFVQLEDRFGAATASPLSTPPHAIPSARITSVKTDTASSPPGARAAGDQLFADGL